MVLITFLYDDQLNIDARIGGWAVAYCFIGLQK